MKRTWRIYIPILLFSLCLFSVSIGYLRIFGWTKSTLWHLRHKDKITILEATVKVPKRWWIQPTSLPGTILFLRVPPNRKADLIKLYLQAHKIRIGSNGLPVPPDNEQAGRFKLSKPDSPEQTIIGGEKAYYFAQSIVAGSDRPGNNFLTWLIPACEFRFVAVDVPLESIDYVEEVLQQVSFHKDDGVCTSILGVSERSTGEPISLEEQLSQ